jgi:hypothetical protein
VATPFRTHLVDVEPSSYFTPLVLTSEPPPLYPEASIVQDVRATETDIAVEAVVCAEEFSYHPVNKATKIKRVTRKMKSLLHFRQRSPLCQCSARK